MKMPIPNKPITRKETYLAAIAGQEVTLPAKPITREEAYLDAIAKNGTGASYEILGAYDTLAELEAAHPTGKPGDAYLVGDPSHVYVWLTESEEWGDGGEFTAIEGPKGDKGDPGQNGADGQDGKDGNDGEDYVLTAQDKADIADIVLGELVVAEEQEV